MTEPEDPLRIEFDVQAEDAGVRLDKLVLRQARTMGRRALSELFAVGGVRVGGRLAKKGDLGTPGDRVVVTRVAPDIVPEPAAPLRVLVETESVVIVTKPAGQPTVPIAPGQAGTLAAALLGRYPEMIGVGYRPREPGLIHRLDTQTSGVLVAARSVAAFEHLRALLAAGRVEKRYLAIVASSNVPDHGVIDRPLGPDPKDTRKVAVSGTAGPRQRAVTHFRVLRTLGPWTLLEVEVRHAYRHQIRVHLSSLGHPIAGDALYGGPDAGPLGTRHALHASYAAWAGDDVVAAFEGVDPLPADLAELVGPD